MGACQQGTQSGRETGATRPTSRYGKCAEEANKLNSGNLQAQSEIQKLEDETKYYYNIIKTTET